MLKICIGEDAYGHRLYPGDICSYTFTNPENNITNEYRGMIIYDNYSFSFVFVQLLNAFPFVMMSSVNINTIKKIVEATAMDLYFPNYEKWKDIYNRNTQLL